MLYPCVRAECWTTTASVTLSLSHGRQFDTAHCTAECRNGSGTTPGSNRLLFNRDPSRCSLHWYTPPIGKFLSRSSGIGLWSSSHLDKSGSPISWFMWFKVEKSVLASEWNLEGWSKEILVYIGCLDHENECPWKLTWEHRKCCDHLVSGQPVICLAWRDAFIELWLQRSALVDCQNDTAYVFKRWRLVRGARLRLVTDWLTALCKAAWSCLSSVGPLGIHMLGLDN